MDWFHYQRSRKQDSGVVGKRRERATRPGHVRFSVIALVSACISAAPGCVYDSDDRCGSDRVLSEHGLCVCKPGTVEETGRCVSPPEVPAGLGEACGADAPCEGEDFPECHIAAGGDGYCTVTGCASDDDCDGGYYCAIEQGESFCKRPPTGVGRTCASNADCAGFDADYCVTAGSACAVSNCTMTPDNCPPGHQCQDLTAFIPDIPLICAPPL